VAALTPTLSQGEREKNGFSGERSPPVPSPQGERGKNRPSGPLALWERARVRAASMAYKYPPKKQRDRARRLRRNETDAEHRLWMRLRAGQFEGLKFRRQQPIGPFIADFCCLDRKLVLELDGGQHALKAEEDKRRDAFLMRQGYRVLRFWDHEVLQELDAVLERVAVALSALTPTLSQWERENKPVSPGDRRSGSLSQEEREKDSISEEKSPPVSSPRRRGRGGEKTT
jgi:very-short-patch-repair endonuclease